MAGNLKIGSAGSSGTTTLQSNETSDRTVNVQDLTDTLIGRLSPDTGANRVKNKDLEAGTTNIVDGTDTTKKVITSVSGNTTGAVLTLAAQQATSQALSYPAIRESETIAVRPINATNQTSNLVASPTGIANTSGLMLGLSNLAAGIIVTPQVTGRIFITINGVVAQSTTADGAFWHIRTGTGTAPSNGGALTGTQVGGQQSMTFLTGVLKVPFSISVTKSGLAIATAVWIDLVLATVTGGTATMTQVQVDVFEF